MSKRASRSRPQSGIPLQMGFARVVSVAGSYVVLSRKTGGLSNSVMPAAFRCVRGQSSARGPSAVHSCRAGSAHRRLGKLEVVGILAAEELDRVP